MFANLPSPMYQPPTRSAVLWSTLVALFSLGIVACDIPSSGPSLETETGVNGPVVVNKTFLFLGGPESAEEVLIDTTTSDFDSLFTVSEADQTLSIEEEVSSFDIGSLDQALDEATEGIGTTTSIAESIVEGSDIASQDVSVDITEENEIPPPSPSDSVSTPFQAGTLPFPSELLAIPDFEVSAVTADSVRRGTLTPESTVDGTSVNRITFRLENAPGTPPLTDGGTGSPTITLRDDAGDLIGTASFSDGPIAGGETASITLSVAGETLGEDAEVELTVAGNDPQDRLKTVLSPLRYQRATLADVDAVNVSATRTGISTRGGEDASAFAGIAVRTGTLELDLTNNLSFPVQADSVVLENRASAALPDSFPALNVFETTAEIPPGATETLSIDLTGRGISDEVDLRVRGSAPGPPDPIEANTDGSIDISALGTFTVDDLYFWPDGEQLQARGAFTFEQDRLSFEQQGDFVELTNGTLALNNFVSEPDVGFETVTLSFPGILKPPYGPGDSLTVDFSVPPTSDPSIDDEDLSDVRILPTENELQYGVSGALERIPEADRSADNVRVIRFADAVRTDVSVANLDVRALEGRVTPFSVDVTEDANSDGDLDLADDQEASQESFGDFEDVVGRVEDVSLVGTQLDFQIETDVGTDAQIYAALRGEGGTRPVYLAGKGANSVGAQDPLGDALVRDGAPIALRDLIQFGVEGAPTDDPVTRTVSLTDENSTVDNLVSALPTSLRFVAQARLTGDDNNRIRLRRPLQFEAGLSARVPVRLDSTFQVRDTVDADFSDLEDVTGGDDDVTVSGAELRVKYENALPLGADVNLLILDDTGTEVLALPSGDETVRLQPAPKSDNGTAATGRSGRTTLTLDEQEVRDLAQGRRLVLRASLDQSGEQGTDPPAVLRATDTIQLSLEAKVNASVQVD